MFKQRKFNLPLFGVILTIYLIIYGSISLRIGRHWDEVLDYNGDAYGTYFAGGRWVTGAYRYLTGSWEHPAVSSLLAGIIIALLLTVQCETGCFKRTWQKLAFATIYLGCVQWASMLRFSIQTESIAIGMCCASISAWLCFKPGWKSAVLAILLLAIALGAYQTLAMYFAVAWLLLRLLNMQRGPEGYSLKPWVRLACISIGGIIVWNGIFRLTLPFISQTDLDYVQRYQEGMTQWGDMSNFSLKSQVLCLSHYFKYTILSALGIGEETYWLFATALVPVCGLLYRAGRHIHKWARWEFCVNVLLIWWLPFCTSVLVLSYQGFRTALAAPLSLAGLWAAWFVGIKLQERHIRTVRILGLCVIGAASTTVCCKAVEEAKLHHNTIELLQAMEAKGREYAKTAGCPNAPIVIMPPRFDDQAPLCDDTYRMGIINCYCSAYGLQGLRMATMKDVDRYRELVKSLPSWPAPGCIVEEQGSIIIVIR